MSADLPATSAVGNRKALIVFLGILSSLPGLCLTIYTPALPALAEYFHTTDSAIRSSQTLFAIIGAAIQIIFVFVYAPFADRHGGKFVAICGMTIFTIGSVGCTLASGINQFIFWKAIQGLGACVGPVVARTIAEDEFDDTQRQLVHRAIWIGVITLPAIALFLSSISMRYTGITSVSIFLAGVGLSMSISAYLLRTNAASTDDHIGGTTNYDTLDLLKKLLKNRIFVLPALTAGFSLAGAFAYLTDIVFVFDRTFGLITGADAWITFNTAALAAVCYWDMKQIGRKNQRTHDTLMNCALLTRWLVTLILLLMGCTGRIEPWTSLTLLLIYHLSLGLILGKLQSDAMRMNAKMKSTASSLFGAILNSGVLLGTALPLLPLATDFKRMATTLFFCSSLACIIWWDFGRGRRPEGA